MRTPILLSLATLLALPLAAGAQIYSWKDASGKTIYSDKPPLEKKVQTRELMSGKTSGGTPAPAKESKSGDTPAQPKAGGNGSDASPEKNAEQAKAEADAREKLCSDAKTRLNQLENTKGILVKKNEQGLEVPLVGEARRAETEAARKDVANWCK
jgi:hypothetical protein